MLNHHFLKSLFGLPKLLHDDHFNYRNTFPYKGIVLFEGRQGNGKTYTMVEYALAMKEKYPDSILMSNTYIHGQDIDISEDIMPLITTQNGKKGVIAVLDEIQLWFSSHASNNFPGEVLSVITQNRKNRRIILITAQNYYMISKDIRSQITEIRRPYTFFCCFTVVFCYEPIISGNGDIKELRFCGFYTLVHNKKVRESYDTLKAIQSYKFDSDYFLRGKFYE